MQLKTAFCASAQSASFKRYTHMWNIWTKSPCPDEHCAKLLLQVQCPGCLFGAQRFSVTVDSLMELNGEKPLICATCIRYVFCHTKFRRNFLDANLRYERRTKHLSIARTLLEYFK